MPALPKPQNLAYARERFAYERVTGIVEERAYNKRLRTRWRPAR